MTARFQRGTMKLHKAQQGFTLLEIMIVVAILAILIAIAGWTFIFLTAEFKIILAGIISILAGVVAFLIWSFRKSTWPFRAIN